MILILAEAEMHFNEFMTYVGYIGSTTELSFIKALTPTQNIDFSADQNPKNTPIAI